MQAEFGDWGSSPKVWHLNRDSIGGLSLYEFTANSANPTSAGDWTNNTYKYFNANWSDSGYTSLYTQRFAISPSYLFLAHKPGNNDLRIARYPLS